VTDATNPAARRRRSIVTLSLLLCCLRNKAVVRRDVARKGEHETKIPLHHEV
jgi:hypothetical protein